VFGLVDVDGADDVVANWEQIKKAEKGRDSVFDGIPSDLPALLYALKVTKKASAFDVAPDPADASVGGQLLALVAAARRADGDIDPETELRAAASRLRDRARAVEAAAEPPPEIA
jgi:XTP/dITP diphosphohydrolase